MSEIEQEELEQEFEQEELEQEVEQEGEQALEAEQEVSPAEEKARAQGWAPKEEWRGPEEMWVDAETFLERGKENNGILRERNERLTEELAQIRKAVDTLKEHHAETRQRAYEQAMRDLQAKQREAVEMGDVDAWGQIEQQKEKLSQEAKPKPEPSSPDEDPAFKAWIPNNPWYNPTSENYDYEAAAYAEQIAPQVAKQISPSDPQFYEKISQVVKQKFPEKFSNARRQRPPQVEGASNAGSKKQKGPSYDQLPPDAKAKCDELVAAKILTKEQYIKDYFGE